MRLTMPASIGQICDVNKSISTSAISVLPYGNLQVCNLPGEIKKGLASGVSMKLIAKRMATLVARSRTSAQPFHADRSSSCETLPALQIWMRIMRSQTHQLHDKLQG